MISKLAYGVWGLIGITFFIYLPTVFFPFIALDDAKHIWENPYVMTGSWENIKFFWKSSYYGLYIPVIYNFWILLAGLSQNLSFSHSLTGISAHLFHLVQILLHTLNVFLLVMLVQKLISPRPTKQSKKSTDTKASLSMGLVLFALPFALHPLQVESVAWASGAKDVLSGTFSLAATLLFLSHRNILLSLAFALLAMLCKPSAVIISAVWLLLMWSFKDEFKHRNLLNLTPLMAFGLWLTWATKAEQPSLRLEFTLTPVEQIANAILSLGFYMFKLILPFDLAPDYGLTPPAALRNTLSPVWIALGIALLAGSLWLIRKSQRALASALLLIPFGLLPVLGLVPFEFQNMSTVADRYMYLWPMVGVGLILHQIFRSTTFRNSPKFPFITLILALIWGGLSFAQSYHWKDNAALFKRVLEVNPKSYLAHNNLGLTALRDQKFPEAEAHLKKAIELKPDYLAAIANLGVLYFRQQNFAKVINHYQSHLQKLPPAGPGSPATFADIHYNLGASYINTGQTQEGKKHLLLSTQINPDHFFARLHLGRIYKALGDHTNAQRELSQALRIRPNDPQVLAELKR